MRGLYTEKSVRVCLKNIPKGRNTIRSIECHLGHADDVSVSLLDALTLAVRHLKGLTTNPILTHLPLLSSVG